MDPVRPQVNFSQPEWFWPSWKFGLPLQACFGSLHDEFNTFHIPIQETRAFHADVVETSSIAKDLDELRALLRQRREQRREELYRSWDSISGRLAANPPLLDAAGDESSAAERWDAFLHFCREFSLDAMARYFALFSHPTTALPALHVLPQPSPIPEPPPSRTRTTPATGSVSDQAASSKPSPDALDAAAPHLRRSQRIRAAKNPQSLPSQRPQMAETRGHGNAKTSGVKRTRADVEIDAGTCDTEGVPMLKKRARWKKGNVKAAPIAGDKEALLVEDHPLVARHTWKRRRTRQSD